MRRIIGNHNLAISILTLALLVSISTRVFAQGTAFSYQGRLTTSGNPADGLFDMQFKLFDTAVVGTGSQQGPTITNPSVQVTNAVFTVQLDFGAGVFTGEPRFLEIGVRSAGSPDPHTILSPRQPLTSIPYAVRSTNAQTADTAMNATQLGGQPASGFIQNTTSQQAATNFNISGNGTIGGTLTASGLRTEANATSPNVIGGNSGNSVIGGVVGAAIGGGGDASSFNRVTDNFGTIGGGVNNQAGDNAGTTTDRAFATIGGGAFNIASGNQSTVGGGFLNTASSERSTVGGGHGNIASGTLSTVPGGNFNTAAGNFSFAAGRRAKANHAGAFVWADSTDADFASTAADQFLIRAAGGVGITGNLTVNGMFSTSGSISLVGLRTEANATSPNVAGGFSGNTVTAGVFGAAIGGGGSLTQVNRVTDNFGTIGGGRNNQAGDSAGTTNDRHFATVGGGVNNSASGSISTVGGGTNNIANGEEATVGGGLFNTASGTQSFVGGGGANTASGGGSTLGGGASNTASGGQSTVSGGFQNTASGTFSTVPGGQSNTAAGDSSFAAGTGAKANHEGAFVWADSINSDFASTANDQFLIRASGGVGIGTNAPADRLHVAGRIRVSQLGAADTSTTLCRNSLDQIATCNSSSLRYKSNIRPFMGGLEVVNRLQPITFTWKQSGSRDIGFGAEEVARVEPLFTFTNEQGEIEGVKYDRISVVLVNAIKELKAENDALKQRLDEMSKQKEEIRQQQIQIEKLKRIICLSHPDAEGCK